MGARFGVIGCGGCAVFVVLALVVIVGGSILLYKTQIEDASTPSSATVAAQPAEPAPPQPSAPAPAGVAEPATFPDPTGGRSFMCTVSGAGGSVRVIAFGPYALDTCNLIIGAPPSSGGAWRLVSSEEGPAGIAPELTAGYRVACDLTAVDAAEVLVEEKAAASTAAAVCRYLVDQGLEDFSD